MKKPTTKTTAHKKPLDKHGTQILDKGSPENILVHQASLSTGGGKRQSYIQHQPGPGNSKRLIAAVTVSQASSTTKTHKQLVSLLLPACKEEGATKASVLEARAKPFKKHAL